MVGVGRRIADEVVRQQTGAQPLRAAAHRLDHLGPQVAGEQPEHVRPDTAWPAAAASASNSSQKPAMSTSLRSSRAQALSSGLRALMARRKPSGSPLAALVAGEGLERAGQDHAAEIEESCTNRHGCRW